MNTRLRSPTQFATPEEERALQEWIVNTTPDWIWSVDAVNFGLRSFNESFRHYFLEKRNIAVRQGQIPEDLFPAGSPFIAQWYGFFQKALGEGHFFTEYELSTGSQVIALNMYRLPREGQAVVISIFSRDITQEWQTRQQLVRERSAAVEQLARQRLMLDSIPQSVFWKDREGRYLGCNTAFAHAAGLASPDLIVGKTDFELPWRPEDTLAYRADDAAVIASQQPHLHIREEILQADGTLLVIDTSKLPLLDSDQNVYGVLGIYDDITQQQNTLAALSHKTQVLNTLGAGNEVLIRARDELALLQHMVQTIVTMGGYDMAWVGFALHDEAQSVQVMAHWPQEPTSPGAVPSTESESPAGRAVRTATTQLFRRGDAASVMASGAQSPAAHAAVLSLPLMKGQEAFGVLEINSHDDHAFDADEVSLLERLAADLAYGIGSLRSGQERVQAEEQLKRSLRETVGVIAAVVESRDPFTAGHQRRVAQLAEAIAQKMGLPTAEVEGIGFGALIHDLGVMQIPAGILARPGKLAKAEMDLIQTHSQIGHDILKDIHLPWPVATFILQHHERLDGSGYPQGLRGEAITLGARIIAVADVVEAMLSHRPFRPSRSLDQALDEIERNRGQKYDPAAADACVALWRTGGFTFENRR